MCVFTNQLREKIGVMFGNPETTPGGQALKFYASVRLDIRRIDTLKDGAQRHRQPRARQGRQEQGRAAVPPGRVRHHLRRRHLQGGHGARLGRREGGRAEVRLVLSFGDERLGQGRENAKEFLREHPDVLQRMLNRIQAVTEGSIIPGAVLPSGRAGRWVRFRSRRLPLPSPRSRATACPSRPASATPERPGAAGNGARVEDAREQVLDAAGKALAPSGALARGAAQSGSRASRRPTCARPCVDDLERLGYVDDEALALALAEQRLASGWGPGRVEADLERLAVGEAAARAGIRAAEAGEESAARALLASRAAAGRTPAQRLGLLARRGFSADAAESVLGVFEP